MIRIHHIGYLIKSVEKSVEQFNSLGYRIVSDIGGYDNYRKAEIIFMEKDGYLIELVSPVSQDSSVYNLMTHYKNSPYHICYESDEYDNDLIAMNKPGWIIIEDSLPAPALGNRRVSFFYASNVGIIELLESVDNLQEDVFDTL